MWLSAGRWQRFSLRDWFISASSAYPKNKQKTSKQYLITCILHLRHPTSPSCVSCCCLSNGLFPIVEAEVRGGNIPRNRSTANKNCYENSNHPTSSHTGFKHLTFNVRDVNHLSLPVFIKCLKKMFKHVYTTININLLN